MDYRSEKVDEGKAVFSNWMEYAPQNSINEPDSLQNVVPPPMIQFPNDSGFETSSNFQYPPMTSPHFVPPNNRKEVPEPLKMMEADTPDIALESPPTRKRKKKKEKVESEDEDAMEDEIVSQPDVRYTCQMKPSRRKGTRFADHGEVPSHLCSAPYKYLMKISHPLDDGLNEADFDVYLTAYDRKHQEKGQLQGGLELEYLRSTVNEENEQVHFYHIQYTLTSFLNQNEKYRLNVVIAEVDGDEEDERLILQSNEFLLVARKNKTTDDLFWDKYADDVGNVSNNNSTQERRKRRYQRKGKKKKKSSSSSNKKKTNKQQQPQKRRRRQRRRTTTTATRRRRRRRRKSTKSIEEEEGENETQVIGKKRKRDEMNVIQRPNGFVFVNSKFGNQEEERKPKKKLKLD